MPCLSPTAVHAACAPHAVPVARAAAAALCRSGALPNRHPNACLAPPGPSVFIHAELPFIAMSILSSTLQQIIKVFSALWANATTRPRPPQKGHPVHRQAGCRGMEQELAASGTGHDPVRASLWRGGPPFPPLHLDQAPPTQPSSSSHHLPAKLHGLAGVDAKDVRPCRQRHRSQRHAAVLQRVLHAGPNELRVEGLQGIVALLPHRVLGEFGMSLE